jgi:hypothetical protein
MSAALAQRHLLTRGERTVDGTADRPAPAAPGGGRGIEDFGDSELGRHPDEHGFRGRRVDLLGRTLKVAPFADPVTSARNYLRAGGTATAEELAKKAVLVIDPGATFGQVAWPMLQGSRRASAKVGLICPSR